MAYGDFSLRDLERQFGLSIVEHADLFAAAAEAAPGEAFRAYLTESLPLALAINTEKARSEMLIAPLLVEVRRLLSHRVSLFSGVDFPADPERGLNGVCDFLLSRSPQQQYVCPPVMTIVEAKNENLKTGLAQCAAAMLGAQSFNAPSSTSSIASSSVFGPVFGSVTTGTLWRFLRLGSPETSVTAPAVTLTLDQHEYHIERTPKILGIFLQILGN